MRKILLAFIILSIVRACEAQVFTGVDVGAVSGITCSTSTGAQVATYLLTQALHPVRQGLANDLATVIQVNRFCILTQNIDTTQNINVPTGTVLCADGFTVTTHGGVLLRQIGDNSYIYRKTINVQP